MSDSRAERLARNEAWYREANERMAPWNRGGPNLGERFPLVCECPNLDCHHVLWLTMPEYEAIRSHPRRFLVCPGHEVPDIETVLERRGDRLVVVEKRGEA